MADQLFSCREMKALLGRSSEQKRRLRKLGHSCLASLKIPIMRRLTAFLQDLRFSAKSLVVLCTASSVALARAVRSWVYTMPFHPRVAQSRHFLPDQLMVRSNTTWSASAIARVCPVWSMGFLSSIQRLRYPDCNRLI